MSVENATGAFGRTLNSTFNSTLNLTLNSSTNLTNTSTPSHGPIIRDPTLSELIPTYSVLAITLLISTCFTCWFFGPFHIQIPRIDFAGWWRWWRLRGRGFRRVRGENGELEDFELQSMEHGIRYVELDDDDEDVFRVPGSWDGECYSEEDEEMGEDGSMVSSEDGGPDDLWLDTRMDKGISGPSVVCPEDDVPDKVPDNLCLDTHIDTEEEVSGPSVISSEHGVSRDLWESRIDTEEEILDPSMADTKGGGPNDLWEELHRHRKRTWLRA